LQWHSEFDVLYSDDDLGSVAPRREVGFSSTRSVTMKISPRISTQFLGVIGVIGGLATTRAHAADVFYGPNPDVTDCAAATADAPAVVATAAPVLAAGGADESQHSNPRLELSYRRFSLRNLDLGTLPVNGIELDMYPVSSRWARVGIELEAGAGQAALGGHTLDARYGLFGLIGGFQYPARVTPFVEGRLVGGVLGGTLDGPVTVPGTSVTLVGTSAVTWLYGGGLDAGADVFVLGRSHVSLALGWVHTTWGGVDYLGAMATPSIGVRFKDLTDDSFTLKLGIGL
jgi:hypothetical protein